MKLPNYLITFLYLIKVLNLTVLVENNLLNCRAVSSCVLYVCPLLSSGWFSVLSKEQTHTES